MKLVNDQLAGFKCADRKDKATLIFTDGKEKEIRLIGTPVYKRGSQGVILSKRKNIANII